MWDSDEMASLQQNNMQYEYLKILDTDVLQSYIHDHNNIERLKKNGD